MTHSDTSTNTTRSHTKSELEAFRRDQTKRNQAALAWLEELDREDPVEQKERWKMIERSLKENPLSIQKPAL